jgi:Uma2 family endonuclease
MVQPSTRIAINQTEQTEQTDQSLSAGEMLPTALPTGLPTMYDLPSEDPEEPGLPDEFHDLQPQLLSRSLQLGKYSRQEMFSVSDMNLYYDPQHLKWYKRPDWFLVVGVSRLYQNRDLRQSYVLWDEKVSPIVVVEFLSPGTEQDDLGRFAKVPPEPSQPGKPPCKFDVYEQIVKVQNYIVYDEPSQTIRYFRLVNGSYQEQAIAPNNPKLWIPELEIGLAIATSEFDGVLQPWLRWCDRTGHFLDTDTEQERRAKEQERLAKEQAQAQLNEAQTQITEAAQRLLATGMAVEQVAEILGLSIEQVERLGAF